MTKYLRKPSSINHTYLNAANELLVWYNSDLMVKFFSFSKSGQRNDFFTSIEVNDVWKGVEYGADSKTIYWTALLI